MSTPTTPIPASLLVAQAPNPYGIEFWLGIVPAPGANYGNSIIDADPSMRTTTGRALLQQSLLCRLTTPLGSVIDCPNDCIDLTALVSDGMTTSQIKQVFGTVQNEVLKDQRVTAAFVTGSFNPATSTLTIAISVQSSYGPFTFTLEVSQVTVKLLNANLPNGGP